MMVGMLVLSLCASAADTPKPVEIGNLHNTFAVTPRVYSGSVPEREGDFAALAKLGVKTVISVDGTRPDVEAAKKHGLAYVHLPFGYSGIPTNRVADLALAMKNVSGPVYVHCALGHGRSALIAAAVLLRRGIVSDVGAAESHLRERRPGVRLKGGQRRLLARMFGGGE